MAYPDFNVPFTLQTDASNTGLGVVVTQVQDDQERVIAYASRILTKVERNYSTTEKECLAVVWAISKFRYYLEGYHFTVITDHSSLRWLRNLRNPTGRLARWSLDLLEYDFEVVHRKGALHHVPDALSRIYEDEKEECQLAIIDPVNDEWYVRRRQAVIDFPNKFHGWKVVNGDLYRYCSNPLINDIMEDLDAWKLVVPKDQVNRIISEVHENPESGHFGVEKTHFKARLRYYWPGMFKDISNFIRRCNTCQLVKSDQSGPKGLMGHRLVEEPWAVVATDVMGPYPRSRRGNEYILVFQDLFSKWIEVSPLKAANGKSIRTAFEKQVLNRWGAPRVLHSDRGTEFANNLLDDMAKEFNIHRSYSPVYHAQANPVERTNRVLKSMIVSFIEDDHRDWDIHLDEFAFAYNTSVHSTTRSTPAFLNMGREPRPINSVRQLAEQINEPAPPDLEGWESRMSRLSYLRDLITRYQDQAFLRQSKYYNRGKRDITFKVGDLVKKPTHFYSRRDQHVSSKLVKPFEGPFVVVKVCSPTVYELASQEGSLKGRFHISKLFRYIDPDAEEDEPLTPEQERALDRELLEIHDTDDEEPAEVEQMEPEEPRRRKPNKRHHMESDLEEEPVSKRLRRR